MELIKTPQTEIKSFLYNSINIEIFNKLKKLCLTIEENNDFDEKILKLFNLIFFEAEFYIQNDNDYLAIIDHYINLDCFVYELVALSNLNIIINEVYKTNNPNEIQLKSFQFIKEHFNSFVDSKENDLQNILDSYSLHKYRNRINCFKNDEDKINYLIEIKARFLQEVIDFENWESNNSFDKKCDIEIDKLKSKIKSKTVSIEKLNENPETKKSNQNNFEASLFFSIYSVNESNQNQSQYLSLENWLDLKDNFFENRKSMYQKGITDTEVIKQELEILNNFTELNPNLKVLKERYIDYLTSLTNNEAKIINNINKSKKDFSTQKWFEVGIALATGKAFEIFKKQQSKRNTNYTEICRQIKVLTSNKTYIIDTINDNDSVKNLFSNKEKLEALHKYLTDNQKEFGTEFLEKYNQIERD